MDFRDALFDAIHDLMRRDSKVVVLTNDMGAMGFSAICADYPDRAINVGIAEQNMIAVASGLALTGYRVFAFGIASHVSSRCFEQVKLDLCVPNLNVTLIGFGPGLAYGGDGPTHHATEDIALFGALAGMQILNPPDPAMAQVCVHLAYDHVGPSYIRLDREAVADLPLPADPHTGLRVLQAGADVAVVGTGIILHDICKALQHASLGVRVIDIFRLKPLDDAAILVAFQGIKSVLVVEEHIAHGGLGHAVCALVMRHRLPVTVDIHALPDGYPTGAATRKWAHHEFGLDVDTICRSVRDLLDV